MQKKDTGLLKKVTIFEGMTDQELQSLLDIAQEKEVITGDYVFSEGSKAVSFFVIKSGTVDILKQGASTEEQKISTLSTHSHFGEMAFLDQANRTASALAKENCSLIEFSYDLLEKLLNQNHELGFKLYRTLARALSRRIRQTTMDLSTLRDLKLKHQ